MRREGGSGFFFKELEQGTSWKTAPRVDLLANFDDFGVGFIAQVGACTSCVCMSLYMHPDACACILMYILMYAPRRLDACRISWWNIQLHVHTPRASCSFQLHWATLVIACVHQGHQQQQQPRRYVIALEVVIIGVTGEVRGSACGWHMRCSLRCSLSEMSPKLNHLSGTVWVQFRWNFT